MQAGDSADSFQRFFRSCNSFLWTAVSIARMHASILDPILCYIAFLTTQHLPCACVMRWNTCFIRPELKRFEFEWKDSKKIMCARECRRRRCRWALFIGTAACIERTINTHTYTRTRTRPHNGNKCAGGNDYSLTLVTMLKQKTTFYTHSNVPKHATRLCIMKPHDDGNHQHGWFSCLFASRALYAQTVERFHV